ncbi:MAG TPA: LPS export ABC transporter periplasmic protein LptC [Hyphomicrobiales bacterium]|nr:LPS export ABC transporter periplasmic protein LptC [Hyphomicrobiales bacterium]
MTLPSFPALRQLFLTLFPAVALVLAAVLWLQGRSTGEEGLATLDTPPGEEFDYFITGMQRSMLAPDGHPTHTLQAARVTHYPEGDRAELALPTFVWFPETGTPWSLSARTGTLYGNGEQADDHLELREQVELERVLADGSTLLARTSQLDAAIAAREFSTDRPVTIDSAAQHMESVGMHGDLLGNRLNLLQEVRGRHDPTPSQP